MKQIPDITKTRLYMLRFHRNYKRQQIFSLIRNNPEVSLQNISSRQALRMESVADIINGTCQIRRQYFHPQLRR